MRYPNETLEEIERKKKDILDCPEYHLKRKDLIIGELRKREAILLVLNGSKFHSMYSGERETLDIRKGLQRLEKAWEYLCKNVPIITNDLTRKKFGEIGRIIDPENEGFRRDTKSLNFRHYTPPNPGKVLELVEQMLVEIKADDLHPVERAAFLHMRTFAIQPFSYGNKRTARLLQNKVLDEYNLPPAIIPFGERTFYISLLEQAMASYRDGNVAKQLPFYQYIAAKTNVALDNLLRSLKDKDLCESCLGVGKKTKKKTK